MTLEALKKRVRTISARYPDREERARRLFIEERAASLHQDREKEFDIRSDISSYFSVPYTSVSFCGSSQLGFSIHKDRLFDPKNSDLDVACINSDLFQFAWTDIVSTTAAFSDLTPFGSLPIAMITAFKDQILRRGMINTKRMPISNLSRKWTAYQGEISRKHRGLFREISVAIYMNEYAFCWKQDSSISNLVG